MLPKIAIVVTGENYGGKGAFVSLLEEYFGFQTVSFSDSLRTIADSLGTGKDPESLGKIADTLRSGIGPGALAGVTLEKTNILSERIVFDSWRNPAELYYLESYFKRLSEGAGQSTRIASVAVRASNKTRFRRSLARGREGDPQTLEEFLKRENDEMENTNDFQQQITRCINQAEFTIWNDTDKKGDLLRATRELIKQIEGVSVDVERSR